MNTYEIAIVTPCFNDQESCNQLIKDLSKLTRPNIQISIFVVDDGSNVPISNLPESDLATHLISLKTNLGHQKAIACGLCEVFNSDENFTHVVVMDSDGEDKSEDVLRLVDSTSDVIPFVFAQRRKRQEAGWFKLGYVLYKILVIVLVGARIRHGNFSAFKSDVIERLIYNRNILGNYAAAILTSKLPIGFLPTDRGERYAGRSKMNPISLIQHGLSAISVFQEVVLLRIGIFVSVFLIAVMVLAGFVLYEKTITGQAILGWSSTILTILIVGAINAGLIVLSLLIGTVGKTQSNNLTPTEYCERYVKKRTSISRK